MRKKILLSFYVSLLLFSILLQTPAFVLAQCSPACGIGFPPGSPPYLCGPPAQCGGCPGCPGSNPWGGVPVPTWLLPFAGGSVNGLQILLNIILRTLIVGAGIYTVLNLILAGYAYLSAGGDPKRIQDAGAKIWHSILGLVVAAGAFVLAAVIGLILFNDANALLQLKFFAPF